MITNTQKINEYYKALVAKDPSYLGSFYVGVKTTGICCISTCRARKPKKENVEFYSHLKDALANGYRTCKVCKPTQNAHEAPEEVQIALDLVKKSPFEKVKDYHLRNAGLSPVNVRRWFKKNYGITFQAYQRMQRINTAFQQLQEGYSTTRSAFANGYESLSGFNYTYQKYMKKSPKSSAVRKVILMDRFTTPLGPMFVCATDDGVCLLEFTDRRMLETEFKDLQHRLDAEILTGQNEWIDLAKKEIGEYFEGSRTEFTVPLETPGTDFQNRVWKGLLKIPYGETSTYRNQSEKLGNVKAIRAVASANGHNRVAIIIPCHRVIGSDGSLTGYAGGLERKRWLLKHEKSHAVKKEKPGDQMGLY